MIHIATVTDRNYVQHLTVMLHSLLKHNSTVLLVVHVIISDQDQIDEYPLQKLFSRYPKARYQIHPIPTIKFSMFVPVGHVPLTSYYRLSIPAILKNLDRILYLDSDIIVEHSIKDLWNSNLQGRTIGAVRLFDISACRYYKNDLKIHSTSGFFNAGLLLIDNKKYNKKQIDRVVNKFLHRTGNKLLAADQDGLNFALRDDWTPLDTRWNQDAGLFMIKNWHYSMYTEFEYKKALNDPYIIHFTGNEKPWLSWCGHPLRKKYFDYLKGTKYDRYIPKWDILKELNTLIIRLGIQILNKIPEYWYDMMIKNIFTTHTWIQKNTQYEPDG